MPEMHISMKSVVIAWNSVKEHVDPRGLLTHAFLHLTQMGVIQAN